MLQNKSFTVIKYKENTIHFTQMKMNWTPVYIYNLNNVPSLDHNTYSL